MKYKQVLFLFSKIIVITLFGFLLYKQLSNVPISNWEDFKIKSSLFLLLSFVLIPINWGLEWKKWKITNKEIIQSPKNNNLFKAFSAGFLTGIITPSMLGNFIGRLYYFERKYRSIVILSTSYTNFTQFFSSIFFGLISILILQQTPFGNISVELKILCVILILTLLIFNFNFERIPFPSPKIKRRISFFIERIKSTSNYRIKILTLSLVRHFVFTLQFWLLLNAFITAFDLITFFWIWQIFFWTTLIPSIWFGKLLIRESVAIFILSSIGYDKVAILSTSFLLWIFNLGIPTIFSLFYAKNSSKE